MRAFVRVYWECPMESLVLVTPCVLRHFLCIWLRGRKNSSQRQGDTDPMARAVPSEGQKGRKQLGGARLIDVPSSEDEMQPMPRFPPGLEVC